MCLPLKRPPPTAAVRRARCIVACRVQALYINHRALDMYRIRRESGEEVNFGSIDELGAAVASGVVTAKAEIFHARAEKWLPIASHPHFKMAHDRINSASAPRASSQRPALSASGQRPAITVPQASAPSTAPTATAPRVQAPQLRVMRPDAPAATATTATEVAATQKPTPRWKIGRAHV